MRTTSSADSKEFEEGGIPLFAPSGPMQSVWPSGLRRQLQVLFFFGRRGFEPLSGHFDAGKLYLPLPRKSNNKKKTMAETLPPPTFPDPCQNYDIFRLLSS